MRSRRELLATWEDWSAQDSLLRILAGTATQEQRAILRPALEDTPEVDPLEALRGSTELVALLTGWQWQATHAARTNGAGWDDIGAATGTTSEQARVAFLQALERQEHVRPGTTEQYRDAL